MAFTIEMTVRGVLLAGKWRTEAELNHIPTEQKRNTLMTELGKHTKEPEPYYYQRFSDDELVGMAAIAVFLKEAGILDDNALKTMTWDDQRNKLIAENNNHIDTPIGELQGMTNQKLVQIGLEGFAKSKTVAGILEFNWVIDQAKLLTNVPDIIAHEDYHNYSDSVDATNTFVVDKTVSNTSMFSEEHGYEFHLGVENEFKAGIPKLAENTTTVTVDNTSTNNWQFGKENTTTQRYELTSPVVLKPGEHIQKRAAVTRGTLDVPYKAKIRTGDGSIQTITGTWKGVSTFNLSVTQVDIKP